MTSPPANAEEAKLPVAQLPAAHDNAEQSLLVCNIATSSTTSQPSVQVETAGQPCAIDSGGPAAPARYKNIELKVEPAYRILENNIVYVTTSDGYVVGELSDVPAQSDDIIMASPTEQIIVLEAEDIQFQDIQFYASPIKDTAGGYPMVAEAKPYEEIHQAEIGDQMQQYQILSSNELVDTNW